MVKYSFSGHESFACKSLWLKKGYDYVVQNRDFNAPGVGKNMVSFKTGKQIEKLLSGDTNLDICTLLSLLNKKMK